MWCQVFSMVWCQVFSTIWCCIRSCCLSLFCLFLWSTGLVKHPSSCVRLVTPTRSKANETQEESINKSFFKDHLHLNQFSYPRCLLCKNVYLYSKWPSFCVHLCTQLFIKNASIYDISQIRYKLIVARIRSRTLKLVVDRIVCVL